MPLTAGYSLGPYEIVAPIGAGGMGEVYRARDSRLDREVAIKVLPEHLAANSEALTRFEREAKAVAALSHPNILSIHDFGREGGVSYAVMELLEGETLRDRLDHSALPWRKAVEVAAAMAEALSAAHSKHIIHRDLKPENIFLTADGRVKVLDFGLATWQPPVTADATAPTATEKGLIMGTIGYMSPEQARGERVEPASDIFSMGSVLYEMVTGRRAFFRPTGAETLAAILKDDPPELSQSGKQIPADLNRLIVRCLEKDPRRRFQSAQDLAFSLGTIGSQVGMEAAAEPRPRIDSLAVLPFANSGGNPDTEYLSDGITESLINNLAQIPGLRVVPRSRAFRYKGQDVDTRKVGRQLKVSALLTGKVLQRGDMLNVQAELVDVTQESQLWGERFTRKLDDIFTIEEEISRQIGEKLRCQLTGEQCARMVKRYTANNEAYQLYLRARFYWAARSNEGLRKALECFEQAISIEPGYALAHAGLADCYAVMSFFGSAPAKEILAKARASALKALEFDRHIPEALAVVAFCKAASEGGWAEAEQNFREAARAHPECWQLHDYFGLFLSAMGRYDEALAEMERAKELEPLITLIKVHAIWILTLARRYEAVVTECNQIVELDLNYPMTYVWLGIAHGQQSRHEEAVRAMENFARLSPGLTVAQASLGNALALAGREQEARSVLAELLAISETRYLEPYGVALIYTALREPDAAFEWLAKALEDRSGWLGMYIVGDPRLDSLRRDPRFRSLLQRMNLAPVSQ